MPAAATGRNLLTRVRWCAMYRASDHVSISSKPNSEPLGRQGRYLCEYGAESWRMNIKSGSYINVR